ncbi:MAG: alpha/beta hydrolase family protein [Actinomycetia bacterium]|nr:alpha/beta hydrolase family protein [Actinomycetes bacterium]
MIVKGDPDALRALARQLSACTGPLAKVAGDMRMAAGELPSLWEGAAGTAMAGRFSEVSIQAGMSGPELDDGAGIALGYAHQLDDFITRELSLRRRAGTIAVSGYTCWVDEDGGLHPSLQDLLDALRADAYTSGGIAAPGQLEGRVDALRDAYGQVERGFADLGLEYRAVASRADESLAQVAARIAPKLRAAASIVVSSSDAAFVRAAAGDLKRLTPAQLVALFKVLSPAEAKALARKEAALIGGIDGMPVEYRSIANVALALADQARVESVMRADGLSLSDLEWLDPADLAKLGLTADDLTRYRNAKACLDGMAKDAGKTAGALVYLWIYDPMAFGGKGRAAIAIGNPDTASHTAVCVPGLDSNLGNYLGNADATRLWWEANRADPGSHTAVVQWMGYDAPDFEHVADTDAARDGAKLLASDMAGLRASHIGVDDVTVIGHSYGSATVADAAVSDGMRPTNIVLIGSPGTDKAKSARDLGIPTSQVYVGSASKDPVTFAQADTGGLKLGSLGLGNDPAKAGYGGTRFQAEAVDRDSGGLLDTANHSRYYDSGSESLYNIADVVTGNGQHILADGMTAPGRTVAVTLQVGIAVHPTHEVDPESSRTPTGGHYH